MRTRDRRRYFRIGALLLLFTALGPEAEAVGDDELLLSGRIELIDLHNFTQTIRSASVENNRFYFNNIFLNLEGPLGERSDFIVEYQPLVSELYLLGGFLTIAEALEGIGFDEDEVVVDDARKVEVDSLITTKISELDVASRRPSFERAQVNFYLGDHFGIKLGRVRNPFGLWDDYSLFRNLSALKTDPVSLGVALRRADLGFVAFGRAGDFKYEAGVLQGQNTLTNKDANDYKDAVFKLERTWGTLDVATNLYLHNIGEDSEPSSARGLSYRYRATYNLTLLGEFITIENENIDILTRGFYVQANYDLSERLKDGLRWNMFFETYDSDLLDVDLEDGLDYRFAGVYFQTTTGFVYAYNRNIDFGANLISGADEEGDRFYKVSAKIDANF